MRRIGQLSAVCLLLGVAEAHAVPLSFEFAATPYSVGTVYGEVQTPPPPFDDLSFVFGASILGTFTIETDTPGAPAYRYQNGAWIETTTYYSNAVTQLALSIGDQQFSFTSSSPPVGSGVQESEISVTDLPTPVSDPLESDLYSLHVYFGPGVFSGPYSHLSAWLALHRQEQDLSLISSRDMLANLVFSENWDAFFTIYDSATPSLNYQIHAPITRLTQVTSVPEPSTAALLALGLALTASGVGARKRAGAVRGTDLRTSQ